MQVVNRAKSIEMIPISAVKLNPKNRNTHPPEQIERLKEIISYQGFRSPIIISNRSGLVVAGHGRFLACKDLGYDMVPAIFQDFDSEEQEIAAGVSDNAIALWAELDLKGISQDITQFPDFTLDLLGIKDFELDAPTPEGDEDAIPENPPARTKLGDLYQLGNHRLLCGDSTDKACVDRLMNGEKADMVYTDPPYGIDIYSKGSFHDGKKPGNALAAHNLYRPVAGDKDLKCVENLFQLIREFEGIAIVWGANNFPQYCTPSNGWLVWDKEQHTNFGDCELAWTNQDKAIRMLTHQWVGFQKASEHGEKRTHPTQKPVALAEWAFQVWEPSPALVMDLFLGSGSTLIACEKTNRRCYGMEIDPHYCDVIVDRWEKYTGKKAVLS